MFGVQDRPWPQIPIHFSKLKPENAFICAPVVMDESSPLFPAGRALKILKALGIGRVFEKSGPRDQDIGPSLDDAPGIVQSDSAVYLDVAGTVFLSDQSGQVGHLVQGKGNK